MAMEGLRSGATSDASGVELDPSYFPVKLRQLDVDDLLLLAQLRQGLRLVDIARTLCLSQAAISQRVAKIESALDVSILDRTNRRKTLTHQGKDVCIAASAMIETLATMHKELKDKGLQT